jgi:hypothetical protein
MKKSNKFLIIGYIAAVIIILITVIGIRITLDKQYEISRTQVQTSIHI